LIEGKGQSHKINHFNAFNIQLKPSSDPTLGSQLDMIQAFNAFMLKNKGRSDNYLISTTTPPVLEQNEGLAEMKDDD
jgi:hypothetical protein